MVTLSIGNELSFQLLKIFPVLPDVWFSLISHLYFSDLPEHALCRTVMGPFVLHVNSGLLHRMEKVRQAAALYDYQPYSSPPPGLTLCSYSNFCFASVFLFFV